MQRKIIKAICNGVNEALQSIDLNDIDFDNSEADIILSKRRSSSIAAEKAEYEERKVKLDALVKKILRKGNIYLPDFEELYDKLDECPDYKYTITDKKDIKKFIVKLSKLAKGYTYVYGKELVVNLNWIDVSKLTDMSELFSGAQFDMLIDTWDVSHVTNMSSMFSGSNIKCDISNWDVSNVFTMRQMFYGAKYFNVDISKWDVSNVTDMSSMFLDTKLFNQPIGNWNTSKVQNMAFMFKYARAFNQDISKWDTSNIIYNSPVFVTTSNGGPAWKQLENYARDMQVFNKCPIKYEYEPKFNK